MSKVRIVLLAAWCAACVATATAADKKTPTVSDADAIRATSQAFEDAFNRHDAKGVAALWTEDGDYHSEEGTVYQGRKAIEQLYADYFANNKAARIRVLIDSVRVLNDSAAIEDGRTYNTAQSGTPGLTKYSVVHVKVGGKWLMSTVRDTRIPTPSTYEHLADFEWMIGDWVADDRGTKTEYTCRWVANKSFIERKYIVTLPDRTITGGVQIIGWNAETGHVQSWNFASDGGHSIGTWQPHAEGWAAKVVGVTGEGIPTHAVNVFTKLDDDACTWRSVERRQGDRSLPDTDEVVIKRKPSSK